MVDAGVQSDHAVDLPAVRQCSTEAREETVVAPEKVDKATITDDNWLLTTCTDEVDMSEVPDNVEEFVLEADDKDARDELGQECTDEQKGHCEHGCDLVDLNGCESPRTRQKPHGVRWATALNVDDDELVPSVTQRIENFADELLVPVPWAAQLSVSKLDQPRLDRQKAIFARSNEHMVIMEAESADEQSKDQANTVDQVSSEGLLNDRVDKNSPEAAPSNHRGPIDGNYWLHQ